MSTTPLILVIDDDDDVRDVLEDALESQGYKVELAVSVEDAQEVWRRLGASGIDLVVCDVHLTGDPRALEGYQLCMGWQSARAELPVLLISGDLSLKTLPAVRSGRVVFISKPFAVGELLRLVEAEVKRGRD